MKQGEEQKSLRDFTWPPAPPGYSLELVRPEILGQVQNLMQDYFSELGLRNDPALLDKDLEDLQSGYQSGGLIVVLKAGEPVGCIGLRQMEAGVGEIKRTYLDPRHRSQGLGPVLIKSALALARHKGFTRLLLDTRLDLKAANALYEKFGFRDIRNYNQNPRAERFMALDL